MGKSIKMNKPIKGTRVFDVSSPKINNEVKFKGGTLNECYYMFIIKFF
jgi:hypothetical protein